ncbi:MAG: LysM peptidoglycan-binding domain-containing protein [Anaerolineales bacterium]|nr:LysM peptidoglycan-binding domain-containing protein [Anaerolineales bacterium]
MTKLTRLLISSTIIVLILASCSFPGSNQPQPTPALLLPAVVTIELTVTADTSVPFNKEGQIINYTYNVKNTGTTSVPGPVTVTGATCPEIADKILDVNETLVCTSSYTITKTDLEKGSVITITTASVNGINSNPITTTVATVRPVVLTLTKTANPTTYDRIDQTITYTYIITNVGATPLGGAQFTVSDTGFSAPIICGEATLTLASNATVTCSVNYKITQADMGAASVSTSATAVVGSVAPSQAVSATVTKTTLSNLPAGSTVTHQVVKGEWLWQIARCYGADPKQVSAANPPTPAEISPNTTVTVPNIGSVGKIYGPPCVGTHTVQSGDTWNSIALKYNADQEVLQMVNSNSLAAGSVLKVPCNSANGPAAICNSTGGTPTTSNLIRISFAAGTTTTTVTGTALSGNRLVQYVLAANLGQVLTIKLTAPANSVNTAIYAPNGSTLKPYDFNPTWTGTLPSAGDYRIDVANALGLGSVTDIPFTLEVSLTGN